MLSLQGSIQVELRQGVKTLFAAIQVADDLLDFKYIISFWVIRRRLLIRRSQKRTKITNKRVKKNLDIRLSKRYWSSQSPRTIVVVYNGPHSFV